MTPTIDVHSHIFNARDIPLQGYLRTRQYRGIARLLAPWMIPAVASCLRNGLRPEEEKRRVQRWFCPWSLKIAYRLAGRSYAGWADSLSKPVPEIAAELVRTFEKDGIDLFVPLMIDYEYWLKNTLDRPIVEQIDFLHEHVIRPFGGIIHPFVPFDPAREIAFRKDMDNPDGNPEKYGSLNLVKDAIERKGFIGVKVYNAMGYRPFHNVTVEEKRKRIALHGKRYVFKGEEYDKVLGELYDYCIENGVPITTHSGMDGSEAYRDASFDFGHALYWRDVLDRPRWKRLRLNLAHFGWNKRHGHRGNRSWMREICEMVTQYENCYTDVSHHEAFSAKHLPRFREAYTILCGAYPRIKDKLLFGIDWHVIKRVDCFEDFKDAYVDLLRSSGRFTDAEIRRFLGGNALKFLGLLPGDRNRERIREFYRQSGIDPPAWWKNTENI